MTLRGSVQCYRGVRKCFLSKNLLLATLPPDCRPVGDAAVASGSSEGDMWPDCASRAPDALAVSTAGLLTSPSTAEECWCMVLDGLSFCADPALPCGGSGIGTIALGGVAVASLLYLAVLASHGRRSSGVLGRHWGSVENFAGLVRDGCAFCRYGLKAPSGAGVQACTGVTQPLASDHFADSVAKAEREMQEAKSKSVRDAALARRQEPLFSQVVETYGDANQKELKGALERQGTAAAKLGVKQLETLVLKQQLEKLGLPTTGTKTVLEARMQQAAGRPAASGSETANSASSST